MKSEISQSHGRQVALHHASFTPEEVATHNKKDDCWVIIDKRVYDVTSFIEEHPGGVAAIFQNAGKDASDDFERVNHSQNAKNMRQTFYIGDICQKKPYNKSIKYYRNDITASEVAKHNQKDDCWIIIEGKVYDVTSFISNHPGGPNPILKNAGKDATNDFNNVNHSKTAKTIRETFLIGCLSQKEQNSEGFSLLRQNLGDLFIGAGLAIKVWVLYKLIYGNRD